jgi:hypothetical protein
MRGEVKFEDWLLDSLSILNKETKLAPAEATQQGLQELLNGIGWARVKEVLIAFGFSDALAAAEAVAESCPHFPELLKSAEGQAAVQNFYEEHASQMMNFRKAMVELMGLTPSTTPAWEELVIKQLKDVRSLIWQLHCRVPLQDEPQMVYLLSEMAKKTLRRDDDGNNS